MATQVEAQIAGSVWKIEKSVGDRVDEDEVILIIESMKMEIPVEAPCSGRLAELVGRRRRCHRGRRDPRGDRVTPCVGR